MVDDVQVSADGRENLIEVSNQMFKESKNQN